MKTRMGTKRLLALVMVLSLVLSLGGWANGLDLTVSPTDDEYPTYTRGDIDEDLRIGYINVDSEESFTVETGDIDAGETGLSLRLRLLRTAEISRRMPTATPWSM